MDSDNFKWLAIMMIFMGFGIYFGPAVEKKFQDPVAQQIAECKKACKNEMLRYDSGMKSCVCKEKQ